MSMAEPNRRSIVGTTLVGYAIRTHQVSVFLRVKRQLDFRRQAHERLVIGREHNMAGAHLPQQYLEVPAAGVKGQTRHVIIIIIMAEMAVFNAAGYLICSGKAQMATRTTF